MNPQLIEKIRKHYWKNNQWLNFTSHYDDGKLTEQEVCLIDEKKNKCLICVRIRTFKDLYYDELGYHPYLMYNKEYNEFTITVPTFTYLTKTNIANALRTIIKGLHGLFFNIKLNGENITEFETRTNPKFRMSSGELRYFKEFERINK
jgi:hypothetical protein